METGSIQEIILFIFAVCKCTLFFALEFVRRSGEKGKRGKGEKSRFFHFSICKMHDRCYITLSKRCWRDGRAVEGAALEMLFRRNLNASSNLALSAITNSFLRERQSSIPHSKTFARRNFTARICTRNPERRQGVYRRADMKLAAVGIGLFRQAGIHCAA